MKKIIATAIVAASLVSGASFAYDLTIKNQSNYEIGVYNGATGYDNTVIPDATKTFGLSDGNNFQIYYNHPWGTGVVKDYLAGVARDGYSNNISITLQQPGQADVTWQADNVTVGDKNFGSTELKHWPDAPSLSDCINQSWGTTCTNSGTTASIVLTN